MTRRLSLAAAAIVAVLGIAMYVGLARERAKTELLLDQLEQGVPRPAAATVDFDSLNGLPAPVARYFRQVLTDGQGIIDSATLQQEGVLRTGTTSDTWFAFTARQLVVPPAAGFVWDAKVEMPLGTHLRVLDSFVGGSGGGRVSILAAFALAADIGRPELDSGALHRYLAEAVWYPTALLPQSGVDWAAVSDEAAEATITVGDTTVSLEFRFNDADEVAAIYSPSRFGRFDGAYRQVPWEGHFRDYRTAGGMRVPGYGEVGWYEGDTLQLVWKGDLVDVNYHLYTEPAD